MDDDTSGVVGFGLFIYACKSISNIGSRSQIGVTSIDVLWNNYNVGDRLVSCSKLCSCLE
jgi:hypothetical protein